MRAAAVVDSLAGALDVVRGRTLRTLVRVPRVGAWLRDRERRVPGLLALQALGAFTLALLAPAFLLLVGPLVLGVPHLVSDVRVLVVRRAASPRWRLALALACPVLLVAGPRASGVLTAALIAVAAAGAPAGRRVALGGGAVALAALSLALPDGTRLVLAHAHNVVAIGLWLWLFRRRSPLAWLVAGGCLALAALLASGALVPVLLTHGRLELAGLSILAQSDALAPGVAGARGVGLALSFAFLQSVHYAVWLLAIPQDDGRAAGTRTFRMAARGLRRELGAIGAGAAAALALVVLAAGLAWPVATLSLYLSLAAFHAYLELAALAALVARRP